MADERQRAQWRVRRARYVARHPERVREIHARYNNSSKGLTRLLTQKLRKAGVTL